MFDWRAWSMPSSETPAGFISYDSARDSDCGISDGNGFVQFALVVPALFSLGLHPLEFLTFQV